MGFKSHHKLFFGLLVFGILLLGFLNSYNRYVDNVSVSHQDMVEKINLIKSNVDIESITNLKRDISDTNNINYLKLQQQLTSLNNAFIDIRYIYILEYRDSSFYFLIDTQPNNRSKETISELAKPGEKYEDAPSDFFTAYQRKKEMVCGPYEDKWGEFVSIVAPITNLKTNQTIAMIGADIPYSESISLFQFDNLVPFLLSIIAVLGILILYFFVGKKHIEDKKQILEYTRLKAAINQVNYPIILIDKHLTIYYFNPAANYLSQTNFYSELASELNLKEIFPEHFIKITKEIIFKKIQNDDISDEKIIIPKFSENKILTLDISPIINADEEIEQFVLIFELKEIEKSNIDEKSISERNESRMELLLEYIKEVVWELDMERMIVSCSTSINNLLGYRSDEVVYTSFYHLLSPKSEEKFRKYTDNANNIIRNKGKVEDVVMVLEMNHKTSNFIDVEIHLSISNDSVNEIQRFIIVGRKVNENIDAIIELYQTKKTIQTYFNHIPGMLYRCAIDRNWTMKFVSNGCFDLTGYTIDDLLDNQTIAFNEVILPEYREILWGKWYKAIENNIAFESEYQIQTASGETKWVYEKGRCVYNSENSPIALEGFIIDISEKKKAEKLMQENERRFRNYLENSNIAIFVTDKDGNITDFNHALSILTQIEHAQLLKSDVQSLLNPSHLDAFIRHFNTVQTSHQFSMFVNIQTKNEKKTVLLFASLINKEELIFYLIDINDFFNEKNKIENHLTLLKKCIEELPFTCYLINGDTKEIFASSKFADIFNSNHCPCGILQNLGEEKCKSNPTTCLIEKFKNNTFDKEKIYESTTGIQKKWYKVDIKEIEIESSNSPNYYLLSILNMSNTNQLNHKLSAASESLDKMLSYYFKNSENILKQVHTLASNTSIQFENLSTELLQQTQKADYTRQLFINQQDKETILINPNSAWQSILNQLRDSQLFLHRKDFFFLDYNKNNLDFRFSEDAFSIIVDFLIKYLYAHSNNQLLYIAHTFETENNVYQIKTHFPVSLQCHHDLDQHFGKDFFDLFQLYPNIDSAVIDFTFLKRICNLNGLLFTLDSQTNETIAITIDFPFEIEPKPIKQLQIQNRIAFVSSEKEILDYYASTFDNTEKMDFYHDYLSSIKNLNDSNLEHFPQIILAHYKVNNIETVDFIDRFNFNKFNTNPQIIITLPKKELNRTKSILENKYKNISYLIYPFTKQDLLDTINNNI